jgi:hypothetical protein
LVFSVIAATLVAGFGVYWLSRRSGKKTLTYKFSTARIARVKGPFDGLSITFNGEEVPDASLVSLIIENSGAVSIQKADFESALYCNLGKNAVILDHQVSDVDPKDLVVITELQDLEPSVDALLIVRPLLLNPTDKFTILALVSGFAKNVSVTGRISGVKEISMKGATSAYGSGKQGWLLNAVVFAVCVSVIYLFAETKLNHIFTGSAFGPIMAVLLGISVTLAFHNARR